LNALERLHMIDLYGTALGASPNVYKVVLLLEELELPYQLLPVDIRKGDQFKPEFLAISPNNKAPAIVDHQPADAAGPLAVFESGAILVYLADKMGRFIPPVTAPRARSQVLQWVFWQMAGVGPNIGQLVHFMIYAPEKLPYVLTRFSNEINRLFGVMNKRLADNPWLGGADYSIADMIVFASTYEYGRLGQGEGQFPHFERWHNAIKERPAYARAWDGEKVKADQGGSSYQDPKAWNMLFAQTAKYLDQPPV
jgi:GSH-dependent disulfide-bond oxidoreductase